MNAQHGRFNIANDDSATSSRPSSTSRSAGTPASAGARCAKPSGSPISTSGGRSASAWESRIFRPTTPPSNATTSTTKSGISAVPTQAGASVPQRSKCSRAGFRVSWDPSCAARCTRIMDDPVIEGFGFPKPSPAMRAVVTAALRLRARMLRLLPARRRPFLRTEMRHRSYPNGYRIEELGPPIVEARQRVGR